MGHAIGDWDNDGYLDWFSSAIWHNRTDCSVFGCKFENSGNVLFRNLGGRHFQEIAQQVIKTFLRQVMNKNSSRRLLQLAKHVHYIDLLRNFVVGITLNSQFYSALSLPTLNLGSIFWFSSSVSLRSECSISTLTDCFSHTQLTTRTVRFSVLSKFVKAYHFYILAFKI